MGMSHPTDLPNSNSTQKKRNHILPKRNLENKKSMSQSLLSLSNKLLKKSDKNSFSPMYRNFLMKEIIDNASPS